MLHFILRKLFWLTKKRSRLKSRTSNATWHWYSLIAYYLRLIRVDDDSLELSEVLVSEESAEDGGEVAEEGEGVVDHGRVVLIEVKFRLEVDDQDS